MNNFLPCCAMTFALAIVASTSVTAAQFNVTKTADTVDGACNADCSLREAIIASNENPGHDTVRIPAGTYTLVRIGESSNDGLSDDLDVLDDATIVGAGIDQTIISGNHSFRIFHVFNNRRSEPTTTISNMTITNSFRDSCGGGIRGAFGTINVSKVKFLNNFAERGAGLCAREIVNVSDSIFEGNTAELWGGGMTVLPRTSFHSQVLRSTFIENEAGDEDGGGLEHCACAGEADGSVLDIINSTFVRNIGRDGGAVWNSLKINFVNSTMADNASTAASVAVFNDGGIIVFKNTILDSSPGTDCDTTVGVSSSGNNLESGTSCGLAGAGDKQNADPVLGELADNGGPTPTIALLTGSPAIDTGRNRNCPETDQRGVLRPIDGDGDDIAICDIGAYEVSIALRNPGIDALPIILDYLLGDDSGEG